MYAGEGNMNGVLTMDNRGLRGTGQINYLAATMSSFDFVFYPDSVIARGDKAQIEQKQFGSVLFPQANLTRLRYEVASQGRPYAVKESEGAVRVLQRYRPDAGNADYFEER